MTNYVRTRGGGASVLSSLNLYSGFLKDAREDFGVVAKCLGYSRSIANIQTNVNSKTISKVFYLRNSQRE